MYYINHTTNEERVKDGRGGLNGRSGAARRRPAVADLCMDLISRVLIGMERFDRVKGSKPHELA